MSCLFNSMSFFIKLNPQEIRNKICDYLQNNEKIIDGLETKDILQMEGANYIQNMRNPRIWGGAIEIQAACNIWNTKIIVVNIRNNPHTNIEFIPITRNFSKTMKISWNGGHYEPIT